MRWQGYPMKEANRLYARLSKLDADAWRTEREALMWDLLRHHYEGNSHYRALFKGFPTRWADVPVLRKSDFQYPIEALITKPFRRKGVYINNTSGSSGHPFFYAKDRLSHALSWVSIKYLYGLYGLSLDALQARFYGIPLGGWGYWKERVKDWLARRERFPVFDLSEAVMNRWLERFRRRKFDYVYGYTSSLVRFARHCVARGVVLKEICPTLRVCIVTSETCTPEDRAILEAGFGIRVVNEYGASETGVIAFEYPGGDFRVCDRLLYVEVVDDEGRVLPLGQRGRILVTSLFNRAMPIIRYEIGDVGYLEACGEGGICIGGLEGRVNDFVRLPSGRVSPGLTFYYISRSLLEDAGFIREFIIRQTAPDTFEFVIDASRPLTAEDRAMIQRMLDRYLEPGLRLVIREVDHIERSGSGKIKHFYSDIGEEG